MEEAMPIIYAKLVRVMEDVGAIGKGQTNTFDKYKFRGIDDVYNAVQPALVKHGVVVAPEVLEWRTDSFKTSKGAEQQRTVLRVRHRFFAAEDGSSLDVTTMGEGADRGDKSVNKAHSSAFKTALFQALCIPTEGNSDSENDSPDFSGGKGKANPKPTPAKATLSADDIANIKRFIVSRLDELELDHADGAMCVADMLVVAKAEKPEDILRSELNGLRLWVGDWKPQDSAPGFVDGPSK